MASVRSQIAPRRVQIWPVKLARFYPQCRELIVLCFSIIICIFQRQLVLSFVSFCQCFIVTVLTNTKLYFVQQRITINILYPLFSANKLPTTCQLPNKILNKCICENNMRFVASLMSLFPKHKTSILMFDVNRTMLLIIILIVLLTCDTF